MTVLRFADKACAEVATAGGKGASLARMTSLGLLVPPGFVVHAGALADSLPDGGDELLRAAREERVRAPELVAPPRSPTSFRARSRRRTRSLATAITPWRCARALCRGLPGGELRRTAGDIPARARRRRGARPRARLLGLLLLGARALLPRAARLARRPRDGRRGAAHGGRRRRRGPLHDGPGPAPPRPHGRRVGVRAGRGGRIGPGHAGPLRARARRKRQARAARRSAARGRSGSEGGMVERELSPHEGGAASLGANELRELARSAPS